VPAVVAMQTIVRSSLILGPLLAVGAFSSVYRGEWRGSPVAIKVLRVQSERMQKAVQAEIAVLAGLHHPRVLTLMAICDDMQQQASAARGEASREVGLVVELMERGSLYTVLHPEVDVAGGAILTLAETLRIAADISDGMRFLHASHLIHRDLKSGNVLVQADGRAKISDFGLSGYRDASTSHMTGITGTPAWTAPEALREEQVHSSCDVYSFGVILWELMSRQVPWQGVSIFQIIHRVAGLHERLAIPPASGDCPEALREMIRKCFLPAEERPTFDQLYIDLDAMLLQQVLENDEALRRVPDAYLCPITYEIMIDPVICSDGHSYSRAAIEKWLRRSNRSPKTNLELQHRILTPNYALRAAIESFQ